MSGAEPAGPPAWVPASVGRAAGRGSATAEALLSGDAWESAIEAFHRAGSFLHSERAPDAPIERAAGYRHLLVLLAVGIDEALRRGDPYEPSLSLGSTDAVLKWGMDCPDALYLGAPVRSDAVYRVGGNRGTVRYLGFQVMAGIVSTANVVADDLTIEPDGSFELLLSAEEQPGNWMPLRDDASSLVVRQFFYDWDAEHPAELSIELAAGGRGPRDATRLDPARIARQIVALGAFVEESLSFWTGIEESLRSRGLNRFHEPAARTDLGGAEENVTVWGAWEIGDDEALVIEVAPPEALYWSVALGNHWWESIDYTNHQSSLNGHQAVLGDDGIFRAVVAQADPGVANWLDPAGHATGPMIFRYVRAEGAPLPETRIVNVKELDEALPPGTKRVDAETRRRTVARRRAAVRRRFPR